MEDNQKSNQPPIDIEIPNNTSQFSQLTYQQRKYWGEEFKYKVMEHLSFSGKYWEDVLYSCLIWISLPAFFTSIARSKLLISSLIAVSFCIAIAIVLLIGVWLTEVIPESKLLLLIRLVLLIIGIILGTI
jgi:hypothetical protein